MFTLAGYPALKCVSLPPLQRFRSILLVDAHACEVATYAVAPVSKAVGLPRMRGMSTPRES